MRAEALEVLDTDTRIPSTCAGAGTTSTTSGGMPPTPGVCGGAPAWRARTDTPDWDVVIDLDELARADGRTGCGPGPT